MPEFKTLDHISPPNEESIMLKQLYLILWSERITIIVCVLFTALVSIIFSLLQEQIYRAELVMMPAETRQSASPLASQLGGAASLIGINVGTEGNRRVNNALAVLQSREFIVKFINEHNLIPYLFAGLWDGENRVSGIDNQIYDEAGNTWLKGQAPKDSEAYRLFLGLLNVTTEPATEITKVSVDWYDPVKAAEWTNKLVQDLNKKIKDEDVNEANNAINFLKNQLENTALVDLQRVFYQLIETQTRVIMLADVREEYVFQIIDPAVEPDQRISPNRTLIVALGLIIGGLLSLIVIAIRRHLNSKEF